MNLILLAGNSISNKEWVEEVEKALRPLFAKTKIHYYQHWATGNGLIDLDNELRQLGEDIQAFGEYVIFAKSAGTLLVLRGIKEHVLSPHACVFAGTAVNWGREKELSIDKWLEGYSIPTLFIEKTYDPACTFEELSHLLKERSVQNCVLREIPGSDHHYGDIGLLKAETEKFLKQK